MNTSVAITRRTFVAGAVLLPLIACTPRGEAAPYIVGVDHVAIRVSNLRHSAEFYAKLLGPEVKKPPKPIVANPSSEPSPHYWVELGQSYLAISLASPENGPPGFDHPCLTFGGIEAEAMGHMLAGLNRKYENPSSYSLSTDFWVRDPTGNLIQIDANPMGYWHRLDELAGALPAEEIGAARGEPAFRTTRIAHLALRTIDPEASADYYRRLLGDQARDRQKSEFRVGPATLTLEPASAEEYFGVELADFDRSAAARRLRELGIQGVMELHDENVVEFRDPDGIKVQISGASSQGTIPPQ